MKKIFLVLFAITGIALAATAQDMQVMKNGAVTYEIDVSKIDSIVFSQPYIDSDAPELGNTITIGAVNYTVDNTYVEQIDNGLWYLYAQVEDANKPLIIHSLRYKVNPVGYSVETWVGQDIVTGKETPSAMINRYEAGGRQARMAINGGFYGTAEGGLPMSLEVMKGVVSYSSYLAIPHPIIGFDDLNIPYIDHVEMTATVTDKDDNTIDINSVNGSRAADQLVLFNSFKGNSTGANTWGTEVLCTPVDGQWEELDNYLNVRCKVDKVEIGVDDGSKGNMQIPKGKIVLSGHGVANNYLRELQQDDYVNVTVDYALKNNPEINSTVIRNVVSGWNIILNQNNILDYYNDEDGLESANHPRTTVGYSADKTYVFFTVAEGRNPTRENPTISAGVSTKELAQVMQYLGATDAVNLDGGGSSCLVIDKETKNFCSDGSQRAVINGLTIIRR